MNHTISEQTILRGQHSVNLSRKRAERRRVWANRLQAVGFVVAAFVLWRLLK